MEYEGTSHLLANGIEAAKGREFDPNYVSVKPGEVPPIPAVMPA